MDLKILHVNDTSEARVTLIGDLDDAGGELVRRQLARSIKSGTVNLMIDLDGVGTLNSRGLAALIATLRLARARGGDVRVKAAMPHIRRVMELTGLSRVFRLSDADLAASASAA